MGTGHSEAWWCLWREEALGRAALLGPLGRLWLWLGQVIWLDLRLCPLSRMWGTSCGKNCAQQLTSSHHAPSVRLSVCLSRCLSASVFVPVWLSVPHFWIGQYPQWYTNFLQLHQRVPMWHNCLTGQTNMLTSGSLFFFSLPAWQALRHYFSREHFSPGVATTKINTDVIIYWSSESEVKISHRTVVLELLADQCLAQRHFSRAVLAEMEVWIKSATAISWKSAEIPNLFSSSVVLCLLLGKEHAVRQFLY